MNEIKTPKITMKKYWNILVAPINWLLNKIAFKDLKGGEIGTGYTLFVYDSVLSYGYQKHAGASLYFGMLSFWLFIILSMYFGLEYNDVELALANSVVWYAIGWIIEFTHKFKENRVYDPWDAHVMLPFALLGSFLMVLVRWYFYHPNV